MTTNQIVGKNIRDYIESSGKSKKWVQERAGMTHSVFYSLLKGEGDVMKNTDKISKVFHIKDPLYFYKENFEVPMPLNELIDSTSITKKIAASYHGDKTDKDFVDTLEILDDFISMIDILENLSSQSNTTQFDNKETVLAH